MMTKNDNKNKIFNGLHHHCGRKGHMNRDCKKDEKAQKAIDGNEDNLILCLLMMDIKKVKNLRQV